MSDLSLRGWRDCLLDVGERSSSKAERKPHLDLFQDCTAKEAQ